MCVCGEEGGGTELSQPTTLRRPCQLGHLRGQARPRLRRRRRWGFPGRSSAARMPTDQLPAARARARTHSITHPQAPAARKTRARTRAHRQIQTRAQTDADIDANGSSSGTATEAGLARAGGDGGGHPARHCIRVVSRGRIRLTAGQRGQRGRGGAPRVGWPAGWPPIPLSIGTGRGSDSGRSSARPDRDPPPPPPAATAVGRRRAAR